MGHINRSIIIYDDQHFIRIEYNSNKKTENAFKKKKLKRSNMEAQQQKKKKLEK